MTLVRIGVLVAAGLWVAGTVPVQGQQQLAVQAAASVTTSPALMRTVTIEFRNVTLQEAIDLLSQRSEVFIQYNRKVLAPYNKPVSLDIRGKSLQHALADLLAGTSLRVVPDGPAQLSIVESAASRLVVQGTLVGKVTNGKTKQPIAGARVTVSGQSGTTTTGDDGTFRISLGAGEYTVSIRAVGYVRSEANASIGEGVTTLDFTLEPSASVLDEVVVTGTVVATERKAISTPITVITAEDIEQRGITRVDQLFRGEVPGVFALEQGSQVYTTTGLGQMVSSEILSRGSASLDGDANPLKTFVDGVEITDPAYIGTIDPLSIERIEIVTGPQAATVYGSGAMGGVMQIFTKKGSGQTRPLIVMALRYGVLESNLSNGKTPSHNHTLSMTGGVGTEFSYSTSLSYDYTGQWRPHLFSRRFGGSIGMTYSIGGLTVQGSFNRTNGANGTSGSISQFESPLYANLYGVLSGSPGVGSKGIAPNGFRASQVKSVNMGQTVSLNATHRITSWLSHQATIGSSRTDFELLPSVPRFSSVSDTLMYQQARFSERTSWSYNMTFVQPQGSMISNTLLLGASGSVGKTLTASGNFQDNRGTSYLNPTLVRGAPDQGAGGFARWQLGIANQLFVNVAVRGEANKAYGSEHAIDWTPNYGVSYTIEVGDVSVKALGSYGRATKAPSPEWREEQWTIVNSQYDPARRRTHFANPYLTPQYSRGPQGGVEIYYGTRASLSINHYQQLITDLIEQLVMDTTKFVWLSTGIVYDQEVRQYLNTASVRQKGWEMTGSFRIWDLSFNGTYSWNDSRIHKVDNRQVRGVNRIVGQQLSFAPTHIGNVRIGYAARGTTVSLVNNFTGKTRTTARNYPGFMIDYYRRLHTEMDRAHYGNAELVKGGYMKSDLVIQQMVSRNVSLTLNVTNLGNSYGSEGLLYFPALGRKTLLGVMLRTGR